MTSFSRRKMDEDKARREQMRKTGTGAFSSRNAQHKGKKLCPIHGNPTVRLVPRALRTERKNASGACPHGCHDGYI
jgi:hypothetical protein